MKETYEYNIKNQKNESFCMKCRVEYNTENDYDTNYYFYDGENWLKDFIDLNKLSPKLKEDKKEFEKFITRLHDYMVHGDMWREIKKIKDNESIEKESYELLITATKQ